MGENILIINGKTISNIEHLKHRCDGYYSTTSTKAISKMLFHVLEEDAYRHSEELENVRHRKRKNNCQSIWKETKEVYDKLSGKITTEFLYEMAKLAAPEVFTERASFRHAETKIPGTK